MDELSDDALDELVMTCLERVEEQGASAIEAVCAEHPEHADALRERMRRLADAGLLGEPDAPPERLGEFRLGHKLGGGGMGVVYAAVQEPLEREVALKIVRADQLYFPGARERFRRELTLIARLAHPAIVPVYSAGEHDGVPYFAMERLQGGTLAEALERLGEPPRRGRDLAEAVARVVRARDGERVEVEGELYADDGVSACLRIVRRVAQAVQHAHERGVLHRDLKPSNVMLTTDGRALVFDFGLASSADAVRVTQSGSRVGSLAYMSPEQVRGEDTDERSDVYGLGALLCEAVTGRPPHGGRVESVTAAILRGDPVAVRARNAAVSRDVETVIQTALAHQREHRYETAGDLARDLQHVLERRPIEARRAGPLLRVLRWAQRHPARAALLALLVLVPLGVVLQQHLAGARIAEVSERADENLDETLRSLDTLVWGFGHDFLVHAPGQGEGYETLLRDALTTLASAIPQRPGDIHLRCRRVRIRAELGAVLLDRGEVEAAEAEFQAALEEGLEHDVDLFELLQALNGYGNLLMARGRHVEAEAVFREAATRSDSVDASDPSLPYPTFGWHVGSTSWRNASRAIVRQTGRAADALAVAELAIDRAERAVARAADGDEAYSARRDLASALAWRAGLASNRETISVEVFVSSPAASEAFGRSVALFMELHDERPQRSDVIHEFAITCGQADHHLPPDEAELLMRHGLGLLEGLVASFPERAVYQLARASLLDNLGTMLGLLGRHEEALAEFEQAVETVEALLERESHHAFVLHRAAIASGNLANTLVQLERRGEACEPAVRARQHLERLRAMAPEWTSLQQQSVWTWTVEGHGRVARGEYELALRAARAVPADALDSFALAVTAGEILAGCAELADAPVQAERLRQDALDRLEQGLQLGFADVAYLRTASEWAGLRGSARFDALVEELARRGL